MNVQTTALHATIHSSIPSPAQGVWHLGPVPIRGYALCILLGIAVAIVVGQRRWKERGGDPVVIVDVATWAVPFGVVGGRIYHVITSPHDYFGAGGEPIKALYIWQGGLGIWGAVVLGGVGAWIGCRRQGIKLPPWADAVAPGIVLAQAVGRWGNWFNNELYGRRTDLPWGLQIHQWDSGTGESVRDAAGHPVVLGTFQPFFLYESIWDIFTAVVLVFADRRWKMGHGRVFALYVTVYSLGRGGLETLRIDESDHILGLRLNVWTSLLVFIGGLTYLIISARLRPGRETELRRHSFGATADPVARPDTVVTSDAISDRAQEGAAQGENDAESEVPEGPEGAEDPLKSVSSSEKSGRSVG